MFYAGGQTVAYIDSSDSATGTRELLWTQPAVLSIAGAGEDVIAQGVPFSPAALQNLASATISTEYTGTIAFQKIGLAELSMVLNTRFYTPNLSTPTAFQATINSDAATVTGLAEDQIVIASITTEGSQQTLSQIAAAGAPTAGQFEVTANTLTFSTGEFSDGTQVTGVYYATVNTGNIIGGNSTSASYGNMSFVGTIISTEYTNNVRIWIKQFSINTDFDLGIIGSAGDDVEVPITLTTPSDWNRPFAFLFPAS